MARGFESKNVEAQQAERDQPKALQAEPLTAEEIARRDRRRTLELARARAAADLVRATNPSHQAMLQAALRALDEQLRDG